MITTVKACAQTGKRRIFDHDILCRFRVIMPAADLNDGLRTGSA